MTLERRDPAKDSTGVEVLQAVGKLTVSIQEITNQLVLVLNAANFKEQLFNQELQAVKSMIANVRTTLSSIDISCEESTGYTRNTVYPAIDTLLKDLSNLDSRVTEYLIEGAPQRLEARLEQVSKDLQSLNPAIAKLEARTNLTDLKTQLDSLDGLAAKVSPLVETFFAERYKNPDGSDMGWKKSIEIWSGRLLVSNFAKFIGKLVLIIAAISALGSLGVLRKVLALCQ